MITDDDMIADCLGWAAHNLALCSRLVQRGDYEGGHRRRKLAHEYLNQAIGWASR